jgi:hypothetical protein
VNIFRIWSEGDIGGFAEAESRDGSIGHLRNQLRPAAGQPAAGIGSAAGGAFGFGIVETNAGRNTFFITVMHIIDTHG